VSIDLRDRIRDVPDFPSKGIVFKDLMPLIADPEYFGGTFGAGLFYGGGLALFFEQLLAAVVTIAFSFTVTYAILKVMAATMGIRVSEEEEVGGLDLSEHSEVAYHDAEAVMERIS